MKVPFALLSLGLLCLLLFIPGSDCWRRRRRRRSPPPVIHGGWSGWSQWSSCSLTCERGHRARSRSCNNPVRRNGGNDCFGEGTMIAPCVLRTYCPVNGGWTRWTSWGPCSHTCGIGARHRWRECTNPAPAHYGRPCVGATIDSTYCNTHACPGRGRRSAVTAAVQISVPGLACGSIGDELGIQHQIGAQLKGWTDDVPCLHEKRCEVSEVEVTDCPIGLSNPRRPTDASGRTPLVTVFFTESNPNANATEGTEAEGDADKSLRDSIDIVRDLITTHGLDLGHHRMMPDNSTINVDGWDVCPSGAVEAHGLCYPCPSGTFRTSVSKYGPHECEPCPLHHFQPEESSEHCIPCPDGLKTEQTGSLSANDCLGEEEHSPFLAVDDPAGTWGHALVVLVGLTVVAAIVVVVYRSTRKRDGMKKVLIDN